MRLTIVTVAAIALISCNKAEAPADTNVASNTTAEVPAATPAAFQLNETTWTFTDKDGTNVKDRSTPVAITSPTQRRVSTSITGRA